MSLAPGSKPFPLYRVSACLGQNGEVPTALTAPRDRLVLVPPRTWGWTSCWTAHLLSPAHREAVGLGAVVGVSWAAVATLRPQLHWPCREPRSATGPAGTHTTASQEWERDTCPPMTGLGQGLGVVAGILQGPKSCVSLRNGDTPGIQACRQG